MVDLEKLAIKRDRGYLVRLVLLILLGFLGGGFVFNYLTSANTGGCIADAFNGGSQEKGGTK
jgi:hypothetical protein